MTLVHPDDSILLVRDEGATFTGDLSPLSFADERTGEILPQEILRQSCTALASLHVDMIYLG